MPDTEETANPQLDGPLSDDLAWLVQHHMDYTNAHATAMETLFRESERFLPPQIGGGSDADDLPVDPVVEPSSPAAITREDLTTMQANFERVIAENQRTHRDEMRAYAERMSPQRPAEPTSGSALRADMTDDQIQRLLDEGQVTQVQVTRFFSKRVVDEHVEPLRKTGVAMMSGLTRDMAGMSTVETDGKFVPKYPHARRFEKDIKEQLDQVVSNGMAVTPEVYDYAYRLVVGSHVDTIANERAEAASRTAALPKPEPGRQPTRTGRSTAAGGAAPLPTFEEMFADNMPALNEKGISPDQYARRMGYADAAAYVKMSLEA